MNIWEILGLNFQQLKITPTPNFIRNHTVTSLQKVFQSLEPVKRLGQKDFEVNPKNRLELVQKFYEMAEIGSDALEKEFSDKRKTRILAWSLSFSEAGFKPILESDKFPLALGLFKKFWQNSMFLGLFDALLRKWETLQKANQKEFRLLLSFLREKVSEYRGRRGNLQKIQNNQSFFFYPNGSSTLASSLVALNIPLSQASEYLGLPSHFKGYEYFFSVGLAFTNLMLKLANWSEKVNQVMDYLGSNPVSFPSVLKKKCLHQIINKIEETDDIANKERVRIDSFELIGDPANDAMWSFWDDASNQEKEKLASAQKTLNAWINEQFTHLFFEKIAMDYDRKNFWLRYSGKISSIKIFGTRNLYYELYRDQRLRPLLQNRYGQIDGETRLAAFVMVVKNHILIEFSEKGAAFYAYLKGSSYAPKIEKDSLHIRDLRQPNLMGMLLNKRKKTITDISSEGRFMHYEGWEMFLAYWLENRVGLE